MADDEPNKTFSDKVFSTGEDPDPRFTLANERTFLAWIRTSLAFVGGGIAVEAFTEPFFSSGLRTTLAIVLMLVGFLLAAGSALRWYRVEVAMRNKKRLPIPVVIPIVSLSSALGAALLVVIFFWGL